MWGPVHAVFQHNTTYLHGISTDNWIYTENIQHVTVRNYNALVNLRKRILTIALTEYSLSAFTNRSSASLFTASQLITPSGDSKLTGLPQLTIHWL
jgi:hypothetical protein